LCVVFVKVITRSSGRHTVIQSHAYCHTVGVTPLVCSQIWLPANNKPHSTSHWESC